MSLRLGVNTGLEHVTDVKPLFGIQPILRTQYMWDSTSTGMSLFFKIFLKLSDLWYKAKHLPATLFLNPYNNSLLTGPAQIHPNNFYGFLRPPTTAAPFQY